MIFNFSDDYVKIISNLDHYYLKILPDYNNSTYCEGLKSLDSSSLIHVRKSKGEFVSEIKRFLKTINDVKI
jgi:hypothetical protein